MYLVGIIVKPQGIRGEIKVKPVSPDVKRFYDLEHVFIKSGKLPQYKIENIRISGEFVFLKLCEIDTRNDAEELRGKEILVSDDQLIELDTGEYFVHDLIGCVVFDEEGNRIGEVIDIMQQSSNDIYVVRDKKAKEHLIPAITDVVKKVDIAGKQIVIHLMEGMLG
jgi:16S rRNA processing protein RimM